MAIQEKALGRDHPDVATSLSDLARDYERLGKIEEALDASRRAVAIRIGRIDRGAADRSRAGGEQKSGRGAFLTLLSLVAVHGSDASGPAPAIIDEAFRAAQYAGGVETAQALAGTTARFAAGSDALAAIMRDRQDLLGRWKALDALLVKALSQPPEKRSAEGEAEIRKDLADVDAKLLALDETLRKEFPRFAELASAKPVALAEIQSVLGDGEALVQWTVGRDESYVFVLRKDRVIFFRAPLKGKEIGEMVASLRERLDPLRRRPGTTRQFDAMKAHELYAKLLAPGEALLSDASHLIIVPDGALQSLPPAVMVTEAPKGPIATAADFKSVAWLARRYAITVLPAVSSLTSLRRFAEAHHASKAFVGFGDPDFRANKAEGAKAESVVTDAREAQEAVPSKSLFRGAAADTDGLRRLPPLHETADELKADARALGAADSNVYLGKDATVTKVKSLDLSDRRVVAFATHGLVAGELPKLAEPALALTPPDMPSESDDGLLRASQAAQLKLNADWVVLSACNTAASDGTPGVEGLSGLAKAFFYAGARSLLVSHWHVNSDATVKLTTGAFEAMKNDPKIGRAEALRRAVLAMIDNAGKSQDDADDANPMLWAPFVVVGEGTNAR